MKKSGGVLTNFVCHSNIRHTFTLNNIVNCEMNVITKKNKSRTKLKRWMVTIDVKKLCQKNKLEVGDQHGHGVNAWKILWKVPPNEKVHLEGLIKPLWKILKRWTWNSKHSSIHTHSFKWWGGKRCATSWNFCWYTKGRYECFSFYPKKCFWQNNISQMIID